MYQVLPANINRPIVISIYLEVWNGTLCDHQQICSILDHPGLPTMFASRTLNPELLKAEIAKKKPVHLSQTKEISPTMSDEQATDVEFLTRQGSKRKRTKDSGRSLLSARLCSSRDMLPHLYRQGAARRQSIPGQ